MHGNRKGCCRDRRRFFSCSIFQILSQQNILALKMQNHFVWALGFVLCGVVATPPDGLFHRGREDTLRGGDPPLVRQLERVGTKKSQARIVWGDTGAPAHQVRACIRRQRFLIASRRARRECRMARRNICCKSFWPSADLTATSKNLTLNSLMAPGRQGRSRGSAACSGCSVFCF